MVVRSHCFTNVSSIHRARDIDVVKEAKSGFEAGRCSEVLIMQSEGQAKSKAIADARKYYDYVVRTHPRHELAPAAKKRLEVLLKL